MLTTDLVRVIRRGGRLYVPQPKPAQRRRLFQVASRYAELAGGGVGRTQGQLAHALDSVPYAAADHKAVKGLRKLIMDRCTFEPPEGVEPPVLRREVFTLATRMRAEMPDDGTFRREEVLQETSRALGMEVQLVEEGLYADLKQNHLLVDFMRIGGEGLVTQWEMAQKQAVLLRALKVEVKIRFQDPSGTRLLFRRLKFFRLLYTVHQEGAGRYRLVIDGPFSIMRSVTKYGLQLALLLPVLESSGGEWELRADVLWDRDRPPVVFELAGKPAGGSAGAETRLPGEVEKLRKGFAKMKTPWKVEVAREVLDLPGVGVCVPDLTFTHDETGRRVHLEVMGYWSRDAVFKRVDLVQEGLPDRIIFAVSKRLRVSEEVLGDDLPGQLYVYKGVMHAGAVAERLDAMDGSAQSSSM